MDCYICDKNLTDTNGDDFVAICNRCLSVMEKAEARQVEKMVRLRELIKTSETE